MTKARTYIPDAPNQSRTIHNAHGTPMRCEHVELQRHNQPNQEIDNEQHCLWPRVVDYQTEEGHQWYSRDEGEREG